MYNEMPKVRAKFPAREHPRFLYYDVETNVVKTGSSLAEPKIPTKLEPAAESFPNKSSSSSRDDDAEICQPMHDWQTRIFPNCNLSHELSLQPETGSVQFIACGGDRCAFRIQDQSQEVVLKMSKFKKEFVPYRYEDARHDGMAMERLQASPYILDIYGYCGLSQVIEPGDEGGGALHDLIKTTRLKGGETLSTIDRMKILYQIASGVADMHSFENDGLVSLVHNDICCHQFILTKEVYKLNDFHLSQFQRKNRKTQEVCPSHNGYSDWYKVIRSPEEIAYKLGQTKQSKTLLEKTDVYTLGNVMYYVFTMHWLFQEVSTAVAALKITTGERSPFPESILQSQDRATRAMRKAIEMCWTHDPGERPTAKEVRQFLGKELQAVLGVKDLGIVRVDSIEPLPVGYRYSDSDFNSMFKG
ncbi:unnamed protein product [Cylindrotheca closterium]|uniref:Protein kinase domain-containing protein n=1 Tax=Cylindrotheca closterium TaxID=2856 RepID=A0AAD2FW89_9STRA|nr:unnamed protein product [Cylindrotheca closterium]